MSSDKRPRPGRRADYPHFIDVQTRWMDNDVYGHVNNVTYYSYFDTVLNRYLVDVGGLDFHRAAVIGIIAETGCRFFRSFAYPELIQAGLRVGHLGTSSVRYEIGLFGRGEDEARAEGFCVHVFVNRVTNKAVPIPDPQRTALARIVRKPT